MRAARTAPSGRATRLMGAIFAQHPGKTWSLPAIMPEEIGGERWRSSA
ncbi:MAG: hypothetical protein U0703_28550 [Anaerolineae bacterium]